MAGSNTQRRSDGGAPYSLGVPPAPTGRVAEAFAGFPDEHRPMLDSLRSLVFEVADEVGAGPLNEELKWGQPSYRSARPRESTPIRLASTADGEFVALLAHCQSSVIPDFRAMFPADFRYDGDRAILFRPEEDLQPDRLRLCIEHALRYRVPPSG